MTGSDNMGTAPPERPKGNGGLETRIAVLETKLGSCSTREDALKYQVELSDKLAEMHREISSLWWKMGGILLGIGGLIVAALKLWP